MKLNDTALALVCSFAFVSLASAQASPDGTTTQQPSPTTDSQEIQPVPDMKQTTPPDMTEMQQMPESPNPDAARPSMSGHNGQTQTDTPGQSDRPGSPQTQDVLPNTTQERPVRPDDAQQPATDTDMNTQTSTLTHDEQGFLEDAIQGSYAEIEGSRLALEKTEDPRVRDFAQSMIDDHQKMVDEATALARKKGMTPPDGPSVMQKTEVTALKVLTGGAFDAMYVNRIGVAAHESTVEMFEKASQNVQDSDLQAMITETLPKLREHLKMARTLDEQQDSE